MRGTPTARVIGLHQSDRTWRGNCPSCGYSDTSPAQPREEPGDSARPAIIIPRAGAPRG